MGIWVTCPLHMKGKAAREMETLFDEVREAVAELFFWFKYPEADLSQYANKMYGIETDEAGGDDADEQDVDIESAIQKEVGCLKDRNKGTRNSARVFTEVRINQECLLFMRCKAPIEPVEFSHRICHDAATVGHGAARSRYLNRLTPVSMIVKATEGAIEEGARQLLANHFKLKSKESSQGQGDTQGRNADENTEPAKVCLFFSVVVSLGLYTLYCRGA